MKIRYQSNQYFIKLEIYGQAQSVDEKIFPKSYKVYKSTLTNCRKGKSPSRHSFIAINAQVHPDKINDGKNEAGMKRLEKFLRLAKKTYGKLTLVPWSKFYEDNKLPDSLIEAAK